LAVPLLFTLGAIAPQLPITQSGTKLSFQNNQLIAICHITSGL